MGDVGKKKKRKIPHYITRELVIAPLGMFVEHLLPRHVLRATTPETVSNRKYLARQFTYANGQRAKN